MKKPLRIGIAGLGTVGVGLIKLMRSNSGLAARAGRQIVISAVSARDASKDRGISLEGIDFEADPVALAQREDVDVFVELIGGEDGPAKAAIEAAILRGKDVVSANKALLALHGPSLAEMAEKNSAVIRFEAAIAGGIPVVKALTEGLAGNRIQRVTGVMNGTCNYILTRMEAAGLPYETVFEEARSLGYLEADPTLDVGGIDASHKLALLAMIAFGVKLDFSQLSIEGIEKVSIEDIRQAADMGYRIKLLGSASMGGRGLSAYMAPALVPASSSFGQLEAATNMVMFEANGAERITLSGPGAGAGPTGSAVLADIIDLARGMRVPSFGQDAATLPEASQTRITPPAGFYLRLALLDRPGALAKVAAALGEAGVSIDRMRQKAHVDSIAPVLIVTHKTDRQSLELAIDAMQESKVLAENPIALRIEDV